MIRQRYKELIPSKIRLNGLKSNSWSDNLWCWERRKIMVFKEMAKYFWRKLELMRCLETIYTLLVFIVLVVGDCVIHGDTVCTEGSELDGAWPQSQPSHPLWVMGSLLGLSRPISKMTHIIFRCWRTVTSKAWTFRKWQQAWYSAAIVAVTGVVGDVALVGVAVGIGGGGVLLIWLVLSCCWWYWWCCWWWCTATIWSSEFPKSSSVQC